MIKLKRFFTVVTFCSSIIACAGSPDIDQRPKLLISAEKSLEFGVSSYNSNNYKKAETHFDRALFLYRNSDNPAGIISSCINLSKTKLATGQLKLAENYLAKAKIIAEREQIKTFNKHITVIESSIAIENNQLGAAKNMLDTLLGNTSNDTSIKTAALQNRTRVAFLSNADDATNWTNKYKAALNKSNQNTILNQARLLRFEAALDNNNAEEKLSRALSLYRKTAHGPGIAATLTEWATYDASTGAQQKAINKLQRALFIRINLRNRKNTQEILQQLGTAYKQLNLTNKSERINYWQNKLDSKTFEEWETISFELENYPK